ncbi:General stress protein 69 [Botrimarina colliarenosi]|uniref:General stress protein 69 n=1 Tax=Botrimarina colliarenosi TaxID=2528001 RepID=A0A5C6A9N5_9BACT|nr:aldo/keto reductase [Botrimarina colliarenosi]TWT96028.1 General stress protein 69 [Botrimarina colliarenosi]
MKRPLGKTELEVTPVALGCWPLAGVTTLEATHADGVATVLAAIDSGINHLDTAYVYGPNGESDRILAEALAGRRDEVVLASKVGVHYATTDSGGEPEMVTCGHPEQLRQECEELLQRLNTDRVDLLYLHSPDPEVPLADSAGALAELMSEGKTRSVGVSNTQLEQTKEFAAACPLSAVQLPYNMLQRDIEERTLPWCQEQGVAAMVYWPLMKGLLAGKLGRDATLDERDSRRKYPMYQGDEWRRNQDFLDALRAVAEAADVTVAQLAVHWTLSQPGVTSVLCGAKRPEQIRETAAAMRLALSADLAERVAGAIRNRGEAASKRTFT